MYQYNSSSVASHLFLHEMIDNGFMYQLDHPPWLRIKLYNFLLDVITHFSWSSHLCLKFVVWPTYVFGMFVSLHPIKYIVVFLYIQIYTLQSLIKLWRNFTNFLKLWGLYRTSRTTPHTVIFGTTPMGKQCAVWANSVDIAAIFGAKRLTSLRDLTRGRWSQ